MDTPILLNTPENVPIQMEVAGYGTRCLAALIDYGIIYGGLMVFYFLGLMAGAGLLGVTGASGFLVGVYFLLLILLIFAWYIGYFIVLEATMHGQTIGKKAMGLRCVRATGAPETLSANVVRNLLRLVDVSLGVGFISMLIDSRTRRLGDFAGGTIVIYDRSSRVQTARDLVQLTLLTPTTAWPAGNMGSGPGMGSNQPYPDLTGVSAIAAAQLTREGYETIRRFVMRDRQLPVDAGNRLALQLATPLSLRVGYGAFDDSAKARAFLYDVLRAYDSGPNRR